MVTAWLRPGPSFTHGYLYLVVANSGRSVAKSVQVTFEPELSGNFDEMTDSSFISTRYGRPIPVMAPGQAFKNNLLVCPHGGAGPRFNAN